MDEVLNAVSQRKELEGHGVEKCTKHEDVDLLVVKLVVIFLYFCKHGVDCILELPVSGGVVLLLPCCLELFKCGNCTPEGWLTIV